MDLFEVTLPKIEVIQARLFLTRIRQSDRVTPKGFFSDTSHFVVLFLSPFTLARGRVIHARHSGRHIGFREIGGPTLSVSRTDARWATDFDDGD
jgi:hypothetical protein